jgi:hypothetical protein
MENKLLTKEKMEKVLKSLEIIVIGKSQKSLI